MQVSYPCLLQGWVARIQRPCWVSLLSALDEGPELLTKKSIINGAAGFVSSAHSFVVLSRSEKCALFSDL
jgi:hypothetical protein